VNDQRTSLKRTQLAAQRFGSVDDECFEMVNSPRPGLDDFLPSSKQDAQGLAVTPAPWLGQVLTRQRLTGRTEGIELVRLGPIPPRWALGPVDLDNPLGVLEQMCGQAGPKLPVPSMAQIRRPEACSRAKVSRFPYPSESAETVRWTTSPPAGVTSAAVWVCL
jgi:hypothetical protein